MKKWLALTIVVVMAATFYASQVLLAKRPAAAPNTPQQPAAALPITKTQADAFQPLGSPKLLRIPSLGITSAIRPVGTTAEGAMDIPDSLTDAGWYEQSVRPGSPGKAVLAAHTGYPNKPTQFRGLEQIKPHDLITIEDESGMTANFRVIQSAKYRPDAAPRDAIFGDSPTARLNIITCTGSWSPATNSYTERLVVFAAREQ